MSEAVTETYDETQIEALLRRELAQGDRALAGVAPVLGHLLTGSGHALISDDVVARMRGMLENLCLDLLRTEATASNKDTPANDSEERAEQLATALAASSVILSHCYAIAVESRLTEELEQRSGIDQVLPPLMQELIASDDEGTAELAVATMAAQARFMQAQRRMSLPMSELPAEQFDEVVRTWAKFARDLGPAVRSQVEAMLRADHDESGSRLGLLGRLISKLKSGASAALSIEHGGLALFASALASLTGQPRELAVLSCHPEQLARLAIGLRAAGLSLEQVAQQFVVIQPDFALPDGFDQITRSQAREMIETSSLGVGD